MVRKSSHILNVHVLSLSLLSLPLFLPPLHRHTPLWFCVADFSDASWRFSLITCLPSVPGFWVFISKPSLNSLVHLFGSSSLPPTDSPYLPLSAAAVQEPTFLLVSHLLTFYSLLDSHMKVGVGPRGRVPAWHAEGWRLNLQYFFKNLK